MQFPRLVYKSGSDYKLVSSADEFDIAISNGFFATVPEALAGKAVEKEADKVDKSTPTREEIEAKATELGLKFDGRTSDAKLLKLIESAFQE